MLRRIESTIRTPTGLQYTQDDVRSSVGNEDFQRLTVIFEVAPELATPAFLREIIQFAAHRNKRGDMIWFLLETMGACMDSYDGITPGTRFDMSKICHKPESYDRHAFSYFVALFVYGSQWVHDAYHIYHKYIENKERVPENETTENLVLLLEVMLHETAICTALQNFLGRPRSRYISDAMQITFSYCEEVDLAALWGTPPEYWPHPMLSLVKGLYVHSPDFASYMTTGSDLIKMISSRKDTNRLDRIFRSAVSLSNTMPEITAFVPTFCREWNENLYHARYLENIADILVSWGWSDYPAEYAYHVMASPRIYRSLLNISHILDNSRERLKWSKIVRLPRFVTGCGLGSQVLYDFARMHGALGYRDESDVYVRWFVVRALATRIVPCRSPEEQEEFIRWRAYIFVQYRGFRPYDLDRLCKHSAHIDRTCLGFDDRLNRSYHNLMTSLPAIDFSDRSRDLTRLLFTLRLAGSMSLVLVPNEIISLICDLVYPSGTDSDSRIPVSQMVLIPAQRRI